MENDNKSFWQRFAKLYSPIMEKSSSRLYRDICDRIRPNLNREMNVLELACGTGQLSYPLSGRVHLWEATDFSEAMIAEAKKNNTSRRLHFSVQDATALPYAPESFDAVVISNALHIMPHPEKALSEIRRVLKPGGALFAPTFIHGESTGFRLRVKLMEPAGFHTYHKWNAEEFMAFIARHGFEVIHQETLGGSLAPLSYLAARK
ncbi:class I SAM-dependent methyltransferase [Frisingicoccus sp.]|uniref:class I SAM-dependent methyltransferase n=1 Tax=Frisingicoccus sp. TaxID=1918627 RepID=UPI003AB2B4AD